MLLVIVNSILFKKYTVYCKYPLIFIFFCSMNGILTTKIKESLLTEKQLEVDILRDDLFHPLFEGNKYWKLKYNLSNAKKKGNSMLLTFGGAYSNHILAVAQAGKEFGFETTGIIRGEETLPLNYTLRTAANLGMKFHYIDRTTYKIKHTQDFKDYLRNTFGSFYLIPEGGTNYYAINGCMEIISDTSAYDYVCCAVGTGGTISGITIANKNQSQIIGFPAMKNGEFLEDEVRNNIQSVTQDEELSDELMETFSMQTEYHFGGYAKIKEDLITFVRDFDKNHGIKWDLIYNGKMAFGVFDLIKKDFFPPKSRILLVHTGGLQGIKGMEERFKMTIYE